MGLVIAEDKITHQGYLLHVEPHLLASKVQGIRQRLLGLYIIKRLITPSLVQKMRLTGHYTKLWTPRHQEDQNNNVKITFAPDKGLLRTPETEDNLLPQLCSNQLCHVALITGTDEGTSLQDMEYIWKHDPDTLSLDKINLMVCGVTTVALEKSKPSLLDARSCQDRIKRNGWLQNGSNWTPCKRTICMENQSHNQRRA